ncbi:MAG: class A beta-lactamase [Hymenobacter sp.]|nr:MAG: class A beta-lactamase [Hymenobacter sp.]
MPGNVAQGDASYCQTVSLLSRQNSRSKRTPPYLKPPPPTHILGLFSNIQLSFLASALALATPSAVRAQHQALRAEVGQLAPAASARVGVSMRVLGTGDIMSYHNRQHYSLLSVFKLAIAMAVLHQVDQGKLRLTQPISLTKADLPKTYSPLRDKYPEGNVYMPVQELLRYMLVVSDNDACDILLKLVGGPRQVTAYLRGLGIRPVVIAFSEAQMGAVWSAQYANWSYPAAQVELLDRVYRRTALSAASSHLLYTLLRATSVTPHRLKGLLPPGTPVAHRSGTSSPNAQGLSPATNDVGIIELPDGRHIALAVFVSDSYAEVAAQELLIAKIAQAVYKEFTQSH